jgi:hypothetical protein
METGSAAAAFAAAVCDDDERCETVPPNRRDKGGGRLLLLGHRVRGGPWDSVGSVGLSTSFLLELESGSIKL